MEYNKEAILDMKNELESVKEDSQNTKDKLDAKERELQSVKKDLEVTKSRLDDTEQELECIKKDFRSTWERSNFMEQAMMNVKRDLQERLKASQDIQTQLKMALVEKEREMAEMRKNTADNIQTLNEMMHKLQSRVEENEKSFQHQLNVTAPLFESMFGSKWCMELNSLASSSNHTLPVVFKLTDFEKYKKNSGIWDFTRILH